MIAKQIKNTFFYSDVFNLRHNFEGQLCENNAFYVGGRAGPGKDISNVLHEICHFAELEKERVVKFPSYGWGLYPGRKWVVGVHWGYE